MNSTNPFAIVTQDNSTSTSVSLSASASSSAQSGATSSSVGDDTIATVQGVRQGNLVAINGLVASYGQLIVVGAGGYL